MNWTSRTVWMLQPSAPFHFDGTFHKPSHFPSGDIAWQPGALWTTRRVANDLLGLSWKTPAQSTPRTYV